jgi:hypothetical protein
MVAVRDPMRSMLAKASHGDTQDLESFLENGGDLSSLDPLWLADALKKIRLAANAETRGAPSGPQLPDDAEEKNLKLAKLCASYLVRRCVRRHRDWSGNPAPRDVLDKLEARALSIVHEHFKITRNKLRAASIVGVEGSKHTGYEKVPHDDILLMVNSELRKPMREMLAWHAETWFPIAPVRA